eukprot:RCo038491
MYIIDRNAPWYRETVVEHSHHQVSDVLTEEEHSSSSSDSGHSIASWMNSPGRQHAPVRQDQSVPASDYRALLTEVVDLKKRLAEQQTSNTALMEGFRKELGLAIQSFKEETDTLRVELREQQCLRECERLLQQSEVERLKILSEALGELLCTSTSGVGVALHASCAKSESWYLEMKVGMVNLQQRHEALYQQYLELGQFLGPRLAAVRELGFEISLLKRRLEGHQDSVRSGAVPVVPVPSPSLCPAAAAFSSFNSVKPQVSHVTKDPISTNSAPVAPTFSSPLQPPQQAPKFSSPLQPPQQLPVPTSGAQPLPQEGPNVAGPGGTARAALAASLALVPPGGVPPTKLSLEQELEVLKSRLASTGF